MDLSYATIPTMDGNPFILYREPQMSAHVEDLEPFALPKSIGKAKTNIPPKYLRLKQKHFEPKGHERHNEVEPLGNFYQAKNTQINKTKRSTFKNKNKKWVQRQAKEFQVVDRVLVNGNPIPIKVHGKVGIGYFFIARLDGEPLPTPIRGNCLTFFNGTCCI